jgi:hypothetical protein
MKDETSIASQPPQDPEAIARFKRPFNLIDAVHTIVRTAEALDWDISNLEAFIARAQHVEFGLSAEIEFAAMLRWLGTCTFVHRLSEDLLDDPDRHKFKIPDLLAVFRTPMQTCSAIIEVKTTSELHLDLTRDYLERQRAYASLLNQPLLIAWKPRSIGFWILVDPIHARDVDETTLRLEFGNAVKNDLMSLLAGDFIVVPHEGAGLRIEADRIGPKEPTENGYEALFQIRKAYMHDADGHEISGWPPALLWTISSAMASSDVVSDDGLVQNFLATGSMTRAQLILRAAASFSLTEEQRISWKSVGTNLDRFVSRDRLLVDIKSYFGSVIQYVFFLRPQVIPPFLPASWESGVLG